MQPSKVRRVCSLLLISACGGIDPNRFGPPAESEPQAGIAGYSFDAGITASGGKQAKPGQSPGEDWEPGSEDGGRGGRAEGPPGDSGAAGDLSADAMGGEGGAGGEPTGGAGRGRAGAGDGGPLAGRGGTAANGGRGTSVAGHGGNATGAGGRGGSTTNGGRESSGGNAASSGTSSGLPAPSAGDLVFSEYVEGSASYKGLELYATKNVTLTGCALATYSNGQSSTTPLALKGELEAGDVYVLCSSTLATLLGAVCDRSTSLSFNGNDAVALECAGVTLDVLGTIGVDPDNGAWSSDGASTLNQTLRRRCGAGPDLEPLDPFDPALEWLGLPTDTFDGLGEPTCG